MYRIKILNDGRDQIMSSTALTGKTSLLARQDENIKDATNTLSQSFDAYIETVRELKGYPIEVVQRSIMSYKKGKNLNEKISAIADLLTGQLSSPYDKNIWRQQISSVALMPGLFGK